MIKYIFFKLNKYILSVLMNNLIKSLATIQHFFRGDTMPQFKTRKIFRFKKNEIIV